MFWLSTLLTDRARRLGIVLLVTAAAVLVVLSRLSIHATTRARGSD